MGSRAGTSEGATCAAVLAVAESRQVVASAAQRTRGAKVVRHGAKPASIITALDAPRPELVGMLVSGIGGIYPRELGHRTTAGRSRRGADRRVKREIISGGDARLCPLKLAAR